MMRLEDFRRNYSAGKLSREDLHENPLVQLRLWLEQVVETNFPDPTAMVLASSGTDRAIGQRYVLLKGIETNGLIFYTDTSSTKGQQIAENDRVSVLFPWHALERQIRVQGRATPLSRQQVKQYFESRPLASQVAAFTSNQSQPIDSRTVLEQRFLENKELFKESVPLPERWGGYLIEPDLIEFWQGGDHRLHDRFQYTLEDQSWSIHRLQP